MLRKVKSRKKEKVLVRCAPRKRPLFMHVLFFVLYYVTKVVQYLCKVSSLYTCTFHYNNAVQHHSNLSATKTNDVTLGNKYLITSPSSTYRLHCYLAMQQVNSRKFSNILFGKNLLVLYVKLYDYLHSW